MSHPNPAGALGDLLERERLDEWCDQMSVLDLADLADAFRESLAAAQARARDACWRHDWARAALHRSDAAAIAQLIGIVDEELSYRRQMLYLPSGRRWPIPASGVTG